MIDSRRDIRSYTVGEVAEMPPLFLAVLAVEAEEKSAALWAEHQDGRGEVPAGIEEHARLLSRLSGLFAYLAWQDDYARQLVDPDPLADLSRDDMIALWERRAQRVTIAGDPARLMSEFRQGGTLTEISRALGWDEERTTAAWAELLDIARRELERGGPVS